jgi:hypothetical protein
MNTTGKVRRAHAERLILALENNRLSGYLPQHLDLIPTLSILQGNIFNCNPDKPLPNNDPKKTDYVCGSQQLDQALIFSSGVVLIWVMVFIGVFSLTLSDTVPQLMSRFHVINQMIITRNNFLSAPTSASRPSSPPVTVTPSRSEEDNPTPTSVCSSQHWIHNLLRWNHFGKIQSVHILTKQLHLNLDSLKIFLSLLTMIRKTYLLLGIFIVFIGLPLYFALKFQYSTHQDQYGWYLSAAYISGVIPAVCLIIFYVAVNCVIGYSFVSSYPLSQSDENKFHESLKGNSHHTSTTPTDTTSHTFSPMRHNTSAGRLILPEEEVRKHSHVSPTITTTSSSSSSSRYYRLLLLQISIYSSVIILNLVVFLSANSLYVYLLLSGSCYLYRTIAKLGISLFALLWNLFVLPVLLSYFTQLIASTHTTTTNNNNNTTQTSKNNTTSGPPTHSRQHGGSEFKWILISMLLCNNILVPGLATALSDASCFDDVFVYENKITAYYSYVFCQIYSLATSTTPPICLEYSVFGISTSYTPPFYYNYSCASALLTNYIPVFFISYSLITIAPLITFLLFQSPWEISSTLPSYLQQFIPYLWRSPPLYPFHLSTTSARPCPDHMQTSPPFDPPNDDGVVTNLFKPNLILCNVLSHLAVLMTFGVAYPFLAVVIVLAVCIVTWYHELTIGRYLESRFLIYSSSLQSAPRSLSRSTRTHIHAHTSVDDITDGINHSCVDILDGLSTTLWIIFISASTLISFIVFDFSGDEWSWRKALWLAIPTCVIPICFGWLSFKMALRRSEERGRGGEYDLLSPEEEGGGEEEGEWSEVDDEEVLI